jgi:plastocyanin
MMHDALKRGMPRLAAFGACLPLLLGACSKNNDSTNVGAGSGSGSSGGGATTTAAASVNSGPTISVTEFQFDPDPAPVKVGQVVTWQNDGSAKHQVSEDPASAGSSQPFESPLISSGQNYQYQFNTEGTFNYICRIHPEKMKGSITVTK